MQRTNIYLEREQTEELDRLAAAQGLSRAEVIRRLLARALHGTDDPTSDLAAIDASFGVLADAEWPERGEDDRRRHLDRVWRSA